jgi:hypothetical protein
MNYQVKVYVSVSEFVAYSPRDIDSPSEFL